MAITKDSYDVVVIGGGLGGMTAANRLATSGRAVLLIEQHSMLGGYATYFRRGNHIFDVALHAFPVGMAKTLRKYWSRELADRVFPLRRIRFENPEFWLTTPFDTEDFLNLLESKFSISRETAEEFFSASRAHDAYRDRQTTTRDFLNRFFPGREDVARLLLETVTYATGTNLDDPAPVYSIILSNFLQKGTCSFRGGTDYLLTEMKRILLENGVDIALNAQAERINFSEGKVSGITIGGKEIASKAVISNANLKETVLNLAGRENVPTEYLAEIEAVPLSVSVAQVYMGVRRGETIPEVADILFSSSEPRYNSAALRKYPPSSISYSFYYPRHIRPDHDETEIVASVCADYDDWDGLSREEYRDKKKALTQYILSDLSRYIPGITDKLDYLDAATPKTLERYTGHWRGASFGTKFPGFIAGERLASEVPGLFHCGSQGIIMSGWLGSANSGAIAAGRVDGWLER